MQKCGAIVTDLCGNDVRPIGIWHRDLVNLENPSDQIILSI